MISKEQAITADRFHYAPYCAVHTGPRGGIKLFVETWRRNGATQTWKTRPTEFRIPVKFGMRSYGYIDSINQVEFHIASECQIAELRGI